MSVRLSSNVFILNAKSLDTDTDFIFISFLLDLMGKRLVLILAIVFTASLLNAKVRDKSDQSSKPGNKGGAQAHTYLTIGHPQFWSKVALSICKMLLM